MCIFSADITVNSTKVLAGLLPNNRRLLGYQNSVVSKTPNVMMLPIPTNNLVVQFYDTTTYAKFLDDISEKIVQRDLTGSRGMLAKGLDFERVGQYQYKMVESENVKSQLQELGQSIPRWLDEMLSAYSGWSWLFCIIDANAEMKNQPLLIEYDSFVDDLYFPTMDVHGDHEIQKTVHRDHVLIIADPELMASDTLAMSEEYDGFPYELYFTGITFSGYKGNGDAYAKLNIIPGKRNWNFRLENRYYAS